MSTILRDIPFFALSTKLEIRGRSVPVKRDQIVVWVSLSEVGLDQLDPRTPRFPALLDTGCNHSFAIQQEQLIQWAGIHPKYLPRLKQTRLYGNIVPQLAAVTWLWPNQPGHRDDFSGQPPVRLETPQGIAVVPEAQAGRSEPRLPLLGLPAVRWNRLHVAIDGDRQRVHIRRRRRWWLFG